MFNVAGWLFDFQMKKSLIISAMAGEFLSAVKVV